MENDTISNLEVPMGQLKGIKFEIMTSSDIELFSSMVVSESNHVTDAKLGLPNLTSYCSTCYTSDVRTCDGHFGYVELPADVYNPNYFPELVRILNKVCPACKSLRSSKKTKVTASAKTTLKSKSTDKKIVDCKYCSRTMEYPAVKFRFMKTNSEIKAVVDKNMIEKLPIDYWDFVPKNPEQGTSSSFEMTLLPFQAYRLLQDMESSLFEKFTRQTDLFFLSRLPVTSNSSRITEMMLTQPLDGPRVMFDDRTRAYKRLVDTSRHIDMLGPPVRLDEDLVSNVVGCRVKDCFNTSKLHSKRSSTSQYGAVESGLKWLKDTLLGKRTDKSFRMVVVGDPRIRLGEIGLPQCILEALDIPEHVNSWNLKKMNMQNTRSRRLRKKEPYGKESGSLFTSSKEELKVGDINYRPLEDGDLVLVNRPPSVHQHSTIALAVKALPNDFVASINPLCCSPFLGDFDGDCLGGFVPQSIRCRVELTELVSLSKQLNNGQDGQSLLSLSHDSLTAAYLLTGKDIFLDKFEMQQLAMFTPRHLVAPAIIKAPLLKTALWTGKQLFSMLLPESFDFSFSSNRVLIKKGDLLDVSSESAWMRKSECSIFSSLLKHNSVEFLEFLFAAQNVLCEWFSMKGLSVSLSDIYLTSEFNARNKLNEEVSLALEDVESTIQTRGLILHGSNEHLFMQSEWIKTHPPEDEIAYNSSLKPLYMKDVDIAFSDVSHGLQDLVSAYVSNENTMLAMLKSGSKGSLGKLVQQSLCVGLQHESGFITSRMAHKLFHPLSDQKGVFGLEQRNIRYGVIRSSFVDGLNPLECFVHARSSRGTLFSNNADLPGTLSRKLAFHLRDLYVAYDATVRSTYGNQLIQFSYGISGDDSAAETVSDSARTIGQPVGALAASSISEALYGALDQPSSLPNFEKALLGGGKYKTRNETAILYLSRELSKWNYGYEYGALEVKSHLERVLFSDVVLTVTINRMFEPNDSEMYTCQWVTHFYVCKETMKKRRLTLSSVIDELKRGSPDLDFHCGDWCIIMAIEECEMSLFSIQDELMPCLLKAIIKGSSIIKKVEILCDDPYKSSTFQKLKAPHELCLKIQVSDDCNRREFWGSIQNACVKITALIDWERSHPINVYSIFSAYGIDAASQYFLVDLGVAISAVRTILQDHLILCTNCLSVTGEFHGLNVKGIKQQRQQMSISSTFMQAFLSSPINQFLNAAKEGLADDLLGTIDAMAWGKEAPVGTGGPFSIIYSTKELDLVKPVVIYGVLPTHKDGMNLQKQSTIKCYMKRRAYCEDDYSLKKVSTNSLKKSADVADSFMNKEDYKANEIPQTLTSPQENLRQTLKEMLRRYPIDGYLNESDKSIILNALRNHPQGAEKIGAGLQAVKVASHPSHKSRCFMVIRNDGTVEDFSYHKCLNDAPMKNFRCSGGLTDQILVSSQSPKVTRSAASRSRGY